MAPSKSEAHKKLLNNVINLKKTQHIGKSVRSEVKSDVGEFELAKRPIVDAGQGVDVKDLLKVLKSSNHAEVGKKISNLQSSKKTLKRPLEKTVRSTIQRGVAYENIKKRLSRWNAFVTQHRSKESQIFPLQDETIYVDTKNMKALPTVLKSDLKTELEATEAKLNTLKGTDPNDEIEKKNMQFDKKDGPTTREELIQRAKRLAYLRMRESQQSAKARKRNKIKSVSYRKMQRRQKIQEEIKQFELLKKINPELALDKLNEFEKTRVLERASLRHKNTGTWAKNLHVRAKYDKDARKDLLEQLQISRQLTQKAITENNEDSNDDEDGKNPEDVDDYDPFNPWVKKKSNTNNSNNGDSAYADENWRKYWLTRNENESNLVKHYEDIAGILKKESGDDITAKQEETDLPMRKTTKSKYKQKTLCGEWMVEEAKIESESPKTNTQALADIDTIFDKQEDKLKKKLQKKLDRLSKQADKLTRISNEQKQKVKNTKKRQNVNDTEYLAFKNKAPRPQIDEELNYNDDKTEQTTMAPLESAASKSNLTSMEVDAIDPKQILEVKATNKHKNLGEATKTIQLGEENDSNDDSDRDDSDGAGHDDSKENSRRLTIYEAFEDDEVVADFTRDIEKKGKPDENEVLLTMPGWGSWSGVGITKDPSKMKRLDFKVPREKRRPENTGFLHVKEDISKALKPHLVSDVPFPYTSMEDFKASLRAPLGRNTVPETAFRMLVKPKLITRKGLPIKPASEAQLTKTKKKTHKF